MTILLGLLIGLLGIYTGGFLLSLLLLWNADKNKFRIILECAVWPWAVLQ